MLGTDFPYRQFYPRGTGVRIAQVDVRPEQIGRRAPVDLGVVGDVCATIESVLNLITEKRDRTHLDRATEHYRKARKDLDGLAVSKPGRKPIHPQQAAKAISDHASQDAIFTCDVGLPRVWAARHLAMNGRRRLIGSSWHGWMANAMPHAIGAQTAFPGRQVISLSGDGG
jgi:pyruvate dehydrogenase (quinone)